MKKIVCELCEGTEFAKEGGMFVCQGCGTKYTPEEAKAIMKEVEDDASPAPVVVGAPAVNPNQQQIDNLLVLASNAFEASNNQETEGYCNKVIELDVTCYKAWLLKGQAIGWQSTYGSPRVMEGANAMRKAVDFAPEEEKENVAKEALRAIKNICIALASLAKDNFGNNPTEDNYDKFIEFGKICANATDLFNDVSEEIKQVSFDEWKQQKRESAELMNLAGVDAVNMASDKWCGLPLDSQTIENANTFVKWLGVAETLFFTSIKWGEETDEDQNTIISRLNNAISAIKCPTIIKYVSKTWNSYLNRYDYNQFSAVYDKSERESRIKECEDKITEIKNKAKKIEAEEKKAAEEAKKARIAAYWEAHKEEKEKLEAEKKDLENKQKDIKAQIDDLDKQIKAVEKEGKGKVPSEAEADNLHKQIQDLNARKASLGIFAGKEKKQIAEEIAALEGRVSAVDAKVQEEKNAKADEVKAKVAPLKAKKDEIGKELPAIEKRISAIDAEFSKDPEE